jgi:hypothetical protein
MGLRRCASPDNLGKVSPLRSALCLLLSYNSQSYLRLESFDLFHPIFLLTLFEIDTRWRFTLGSSLRPHYICTQSV